MKLEEGKYYLTREGRKFGPMFRTSHNEGNMAWNCVGGFGWTDEGTIFFYRPGKYDLVSEWQEEDQGPKLSGETIDRIAIDSLKWHLKDKDMEPLQLEAFRIVLRYYGVSV